MATNKSRIKKLEKSKSKQPEQIITVIEIVKHYEGGTQVSERWTRDSQTKEFVFDSGDLNDNQ